MRSCLIPTPALGATGSTTCRFGQGDSAALAAAERVFVDGLTEMWAARPAAGRRALLASIMNRNNVLALRATIEAARAGSADGGFAQTAASVGSLVTRGIRTTDAISRQFA